MYLRLILKWVWHHKINIHWIHKYTHTNKWMTNQVSALKQNVCSLNQIFTGDTSNDIISPDQQGQSPQNPWDSTLLKESEIFQKTPAINLTVSSIRTRIDQSVSVYP